MRTLNGYLFPVFIPDLVLAFQKCSFFQKLAPSKFIIMAKFLSLRYINAFYNSNKTNHFLSLLYFNISLLRKI